MSVQQAEFTDEATGAVHAQHVLLGSAVVLDDGDGTAEDDEERLAALPLPDQHVVGSHGPALPVLRQTCCLVLREARVRAVDVRGLPEGGLVRFLRDRFSARQRLVAGHQTNAS